MNCEPNDRPIRASMLLGVTLGMLLIALGFSSGIFVTVSLLLLWLSRVGGHS